MAATRSVPVTFSVITGGLSCIVMSEAHWILRCLFRAWRVKYLRESKLAAKICNGPVKLDTKLLFESVDNYDVFSHWAANSAGVRYPSEE